MQINPDVYPRSRIEKEILESMINYIAPIDEEGEKTDGNPYAEYKDQAVHDIFVFIQLINLNRCISDQSRIDLMVMLHKHHGLNIQSKRYYLTLISVADDVRWAHEDLWNQECGYNEYLEIQEKSIRRLERRL